MATLHTPKQYAAVCTGSKKADLACLHTPKQYAAVCAPLKNGQFGVPAYPEYGYSVVHNGP